MVLRSASQPAILAPLPRRAIERPRPESTRNLLLAALPEQSLETLLARLVQVRLPARRVLREPGQPIRTVHFPETGVLAHTVRLASGAAVEVNLVGFEGMAGLAAFLGAESEPLEVATLIPGTFLRMPADEFTSLAARDPALVDRLHRYAQAILSTRACSVGCDRLHPVPARLARWLLKTHDRVLTDEFRLTQETMALMLGVARPTLTAAVLAIERDGLIEHRRGRIRIVDRSGLESLACECYWAVRDEFDRLIGWRID